MSRLPHHPFAMSMTPVRACLLIALSAALPAAAQETADAALVTAAEGSVARAVAKGAPQPVPAFVKLRRGDVLTLTKAKLQLVYFANGRQESWQGSGRLEVLDGESRASGLPAPEAKTLPAIVVRQIARTPSLDSQGRAGALRLRSMPAHDLARLDNTYRELRAQAADDDLTPETYLLSGLAEARAAERIEQVLADLQKSRPNDARVAELAKLYRPAPR